MLVALLFLTAADDCARYANTPFPAADQPSATEAEAMKGCDAEVLFYGIGVKRDPVAARKCAYVQKANKEDLVFGGDGLLMMIYASGDGATQNLDLAARLACETSFADAEKEGRLAEIAKRRQTPSKDAFDICDHITSGFMSGHCAAHRERVRDLGRSKRRKAVEAALGNPPELAALNKAAQVYFKAREENEVDLSGSARAQFVIEERGKLETGLLDALDRLAKKEQPKAGTFADADKALNEVYGRVMKITDPSWGTVSKDGIKKTQRVWIKYRDAFVALAKTDEWKAWMTTERTTLLRGFLDP